MFAGVHRITITGDGSHAALLNRRQLPAGLYGPRFRLVSAPLDLEISLPRASRKTFCDELDKVKLDENAIAVRSSPLGS